MVNLDNLQIIKNLDKGKAMESISMLADQCQQAWNEAYCLSFPSEYEKVKNIVCAGMGGSAYGVRIVKSLYDGAKITRIPIEMVNNYWLPGYIDKETLVVLSSYSGNTEEVLACAEEAKRKGSLITGISSGGALGDFLRKNNFPSYIFDPVYNPSKQPRIGQGYMQIGLIAILSRLKFIPVASEEIDKLVYFLKKRTKELDERVAEKKNRAKKMAQILYSRIPVFIVADFLEGAAHAIRNPFNETAKQFAQYFVVPELNHHLMEGLKFPKENRHLLRFVFVFSDIYDTRNKKRLELTQKVVEKNGFKTEKIVLKGISALIQTMELIQFGSWVTFYLAILNGIDPNKVPWVDYFKRQLKKK